MKSKKEILKQFKEHYNISKYGLKGQYRLVQECRAFYAGDYMNYRDEVLYGRGSSRRLQEVQFNRVKPYVNSIVGFFAQQRRKPDYQAKVMQSEEQRALSDYLNGFSDYVRENTHADQIETKQDKDMIIGGVGATDTAITTKMGTATRLPGGEVLTERVDILQVGWDPQSIQTNLLDSRWVYRAKDYDVKEAEELFNADEDDFESVNFNDDNTVDYKFNPYGGIQDKIGYEYVDPERKMVRVYFYQWFEIEKFDRVENPLLKMSNPELAQLLFQALGSVEYEMEDELFAFNPNAQILTITKDNRSRVREIFELFEIPYRPVTDKRKVFYTAIVSGDRVFSRYKSPSQQGFTIKFKTGDRDEVNHLWMGVVSSMRDPQRYYNKSLTELMLIIAGNSRGGVMVEQSAIDNVQEFERKWAMHNSAMVVQDGALSGGKIQPKATPKLQSGYEEILAISDANVSKVTGIDESFFGAIAGGNETAMLQRQRIKQATTTLALYMDAIALYAKEQARLMLTFMRLLSQASDGTIFNMNDDDGNQIFEVLSPQFFAEEYEVAIGEAPETPLQKEYYTTTLIDLGRSMQAIGDPRYSQVYAAAVKYMPIPNRDKNQIVELLLGEQPQDQQMVQTIELLQNRIAQLEGQSEQARLAKMTAETEKIMSDVRYKELEGREKVEDIEAKSIENDIMATKPLNDVNVTI